MGGEGNLPSGGDFNQAGELSCTIRASGYCIVYPANRGYSTSYMILVKNKYLTDSLCRYFCSSVYIKCSFQGI